MKDKYESTDIRSLVRRDCVHRDVYIDPEIFNLETQRIFARAWHYLCHESQLPDTGDYMTTDIAGNPVIVIRHDDRTIKVLHNRCAHRGAKVLENTQGNARVLSCIYHGWRYRTDGELLSIPCRDNYRNTDVENNQAHYGLARNKVGKLPRLHFCKPVSERARFNRLVGRRPARPGQYD